MINSSSTFIWQGRIHIGDEPGIYGNGHYAGLSMEFPLTIKNFNAQQPIADTIKLEFLTESVAVFAGYLGHLIVVRQYTPDPQPANPYSGRKQSLKVLTELFTEPLLRSLIFQSVAVQTRFT